jgi:hypothetical protein
MSTKCAIRTERRIREYLIEMQVTWFADNLNGQVHFATTIKKRCGGLQFLSVKCPDLILDVIPCEIDSAHEGQSGGASIPTHHLGVCRSWHIPDFDSCYVATSNKALVGCREPFGRWHPSTDITSGPGSCSFPMVKHRILRTKLWDIVSLRIRMNPL